MIIDKKYFYFEVFRWHHLYTGLILFGISLSRLDTIYDIPLFCLSIWMIIDDVGQHIMQAVYGKNYQSFGHYIGRPCYHLRNWIIRQTKWTWLDRF